MKLRRKPKVTLKSFFEKNFNNEQLWKSKKGNIELLVELVNLIRPKNPKKITKVDLSLLIYLLQENHQLSEEYEKLCECLLTSHP